MKVRVKFNGQSHRIDLGDGAASQLTLIDLMRGVSDTLHLDPRDFELSLNRNDFLAGEDSPLSNFGIVSGDLIYVLQSEINPVNQNVSQRPQLLESRSSSDTSSATIDSSAPLLNKTVESSSSESICQPSASPGRPSANNEDAHPVSTMDPEEDDHIFHESQVNRFLLEPLVIRESTADQVPAVLNQLFASSTWSNANEALWVVIHVLMLESGFVPSGHEELTSMPQNWKQKGFYSCNYDYIITPQMSVPCVVVGVTIGSSISLHGIATGKEEFKTDNLQLKAEHYVRSLSSDAATSFRALDKLSREVKDAICLPLTSHLTRACGLNDFQGLMGLPCELRVRLLSYLDAKSLCSLGSTCCHWNAIYKDANVWRRLYLKHFRIPSDISLGRDWYELYKERYIARKKEREEWHQRALLFGDDHFPPYPRPNPPPLFGPGGGGNPFFPHILGGDYDLNPDFAAGVPDPNGRRLLGRGPRLDPLGLPASAEPSSGLFNGPHGPMLPGRSRRGRSNLAGNPFAHF